MKKENRPPLKFRFHNPNSEVATVDLLLSVFMDVQKSKADKAVYAELENKEEAEKSKHDK
ncbi:MAG: hypothetical protein K2O89_02125 [Clostridia bacterium]|nr:hypothetical protein [Clostridia bacterium]